jgi:hypothetical protein
MTAPQWLLWLQTGIQLVGLVALIWYTWDTRRIRLASQEQAESSQKPCLMLRTEARQPVDVVLQMHGTDGAMIVGQSGGRLVIENIGTGPAINVRCRLRATDFNRQESAVTHESYLQNLAPNGMSELPVARETLRSADYEFLTYNESLSGRRYESVISIKNLVLTQSVFRQVMARPI